MKLLVESHICTSGVHCDRCREMDRGRKYRKKWGEHYELPPGGVDFECPKGKPWRTPGLGDTVAKIIRVLTFGKVKPCGKCKKRQEALNRAVPYSSIT